MDDSQRVLITGATGHLGANLVRNRLAAGQPVRVLLRSGHSTEAIDGLDGDRAYGDLRDSDAVRKAARGCRGVYHCGGKVSTIAGSHRELFETNVMGVRSVLDAARAERVERVVVTSSLSVVGQIDDQVADERTP